MNLVGNQKQKAVLSTVLVSFLNVLNTTLTEIQYEV